MLSGVKRRAASRSFLPSPLADSPETHRGTSSWRQRLLVASVIASFRNRVRWQMDCLDALGFRAERKKGRAGEAGRPVDV